MIGQQGNLDLVSAKQDR